MAQKTLMARRIASNSVRHAVSIVALGVGVDRIRRNCTGFCSAYFLWRWFFLRNLQEIRVLSRRENFRMGSSLKVSAPS